MKNKRSKKIKANSNKRIKNRSNQKFSKTSAFIFGIGPMVA